MEYPVYYVPSGYGEAEITEKRSRFIGRVWRTESEEEALAHLNEMREQHWDATHNVFAYSIREGSLMRYSDDGEPHGTSGKPTLDVFTGAKVTNFCCVITRYFGGILLGTGGLVRAYSQTAKAALENAGISVVRMWRKMLVACPYNLFERVRAELALIGGSEESIDYAGDVTLSVLVPEETAEAFTLRLADISAGKIETISEGNEYIAGKL